MNRLRAALSWAVWAAVAPSGALLAMAAAGAALRAVQWMVPVPPAALVACAFLSGVAGAYAAIPFARWLDRLEVLK